MRLTFQADGYVTERDGLVGQPGVVLRQVPGSDRNRSRSMWASTSTARPSRAQVGADGDPGPVEQPWFRRDVWITLPEGHLLQLSGPSTPEKWAKRFLTSAIGGLARTGF
jgi:hypothetical protein